MAHNSNDRRPNVLVFFTDQQRWDTAGVHGNPLDLTPNFDRMAQRGTHVARSFTCQPVCGPARSALQTGLYPTVTGCHTNGRPLPPDAKTLAHFFREAGYTTGYIGKWHLAGEEPVPLQRRGGYEYWLAANVLEHTSEPYDTVVYNNENQPCKLPGYRVDALTDAAIRYIAQPRRQPWYLFMSFLEPHHQNRLDDYPPPEGYRERYAGRWIPPDLAALGGSTHQHLGGYYGMVKRLDEALGRMLDALTSLGQRENTVVLFTSDHGNHFKTRNSEYKRSCHESSIRVPTAICGPGFDGGGRIEHLVSLIDLPPTLLQAAGIEAPSQMQGRAIQPLLGGRSDPARHDDVFVQISESHCGRALRTGRWKYAVVALDGDGASRHATQYREEFLYDLESDPYELANLVGLGSHEQVRQQLRSRLLQRMIEAGEPAPAIEPAAVTSRGRKVLEHELPGEASSVDPQGNKLHL